MTSVSNTSGHPTGSAPQLRPRQLRFVDEYLVDLNATQAAIRAGYAPSSADVEGPRLLGNHRIAAAIQAAQIARQERTQISTDEVVRRLWELFQVDVRSIVRIEKDPCRYCWGADHREPAETPGGGEGRATSLVPSLAVNAEANAHQGAMASDPRGGPDPTCPGCHGRGLDHLVVTPSGQLDAASARMIASIKQTRHGIEVKLHDQLGPTKLLMQHLGLLTRRVEHDIGDGFADALERGRLRAKQNERAARSGPRDA